ncbi:hypothetical protein [Saccharopolyspora gloriosae]|uniref:hypothetical protein n=1 Tax=Saccharopolyspora gloriosae TaxID=455344 RepID=UPI001FB73FA9|nr:hypothetical protein [Saccharopolyspora gloriosae]
MDGLVLIHHAGRRGPHDRTRFAPENVVRAAAPDSCDPLCGILPGLCAGVAAPPRPLALLRIIRETGAPWACGPSDGRWHRLQRSDRGPLRCVCGHLVHGPAHLRRTRPNAGHLGRALCPSATGALPTFIA